MKLSQIKSAIKNSVISKIEDIDILYFGNKNGKNVVIVKGKKNAAIIDVCSEEVISYINLNITKNIKEFFKTIEEACEFLKKQCFYKNLKITDYSDPCGFVVSVDIFIETSNEYIVSELLKRVK